jgi:tetratricopeptide (TPR) repeat protein
VKALDIFNQVYGEEHECVAMCLNNMGADYVKKRNFDQARFVYQQALVIGEKSLPPNLPNLAASHMNIGIAYGKVNQFNLSLEHLERSLQMKLLSLPFDHRDICLLPI